MKSELAKQFENETGEKVLYHPRTYIQWLEKELTALRDRLEAAEKLMNHCRNCHPKTKKFCKTICKQGREYFTIPAPERKEEKK